MRALFCRGAASEGEGVPGVAQGDLLQDVREAER